MLARFCVWKIQLLLFFCGFSPWCHGKFVPEDFEEKLVALYKVIEYIRQRPVQMNADVTFSVTIVEANLAASLMHENARFLDCEYRRTLMAILKLCESIRRRLLHEIIPQNEDIGLIHETLNFPGLWMRKIEWRRGAIPLKGRRTNSKLTDQNVRELVMQGTPNEAESDRCLAEIIRKSWTLDRRVPDSCLEILTNGQSVRGYPLTHRLLIVRVAETLRCNQGLPTSELILAYCTAIRQDLIDIETFGFPYQTPDLMMEQVVLCGMEGFLEFTEKRYEKTVLNWSRPGGCFSSFGNRVRRSEGRVSRRASARTDFGCDSHATGLAAASLSLFIRENLENPHGSHE